MLKMTIIVLKSHKTVIHSFLVFRHDSEYPNREFAVFLLKVESVNNNSFVSVVEGFSKLAVDI